MKVMDGSQRSAELYDLPRNQVSEAFLYTSSGEPLHAQRRVRILLRGTYEMILVQARKPMAQLPMLRSW